MFRQKYNVVLTVSILLCRHKFSIAYKPVVSKITNKYILIAPPQNTFIRGSLIFLHGLGDTGNGWLDTCYYMAFNIPGLRVILPTAPSQPVSMNGGYVMPSWYDIKGLDDRADETCNGIEESRQTVLKLIQDENDVGVKNTQIVLGGFSQGGAMSLWTGLQLNKPLAGVLSLSGYLPNSAEWKLNAAAIVTPTRIFHGEDDPLVQLWMAKKTYEIIRKAGLTDLEMKTYPDLTHSVNEEEISDVINWLKQRLPENISE